MDLGYIVFMIESEEAFNKHQQNIEAAIEDMRELKQKGFDPHFYLEDVLHYNNLNYDLLTFQERQLILNA